MEMFGTKKEYVRMCCAYRQTDMSRACIYCIICGYRGMNACVDSKRRRERDRVCLCVCDANESIVQWEQKASAATASVAAAASIVDDG